MVFVRAAVCLVLLAILSAPASGSDLSAPAAPSLDDWSFLPTDVIGARTFRHDHPEWDGRGVVIGILDTGVDLGTEGLLRTSDGKPKILDARDFTGEGDVKLTEAVRDTVDGRASFRDESGRRVFGADRLPAVSADGKYLLGFLEESQYENSPVHDLNDDGKTGERFGVLVFPAREDPADSDWVALVDLDGDGNLDDETPVRSYHVARETLRFRSDTDQPKLHRETGGLTIFPHERKVEIYVGGGAHGTHVAGIASGYRLGGTEGYDGVAPGAQLLSLKIGHNSLSGGATTTGSVKKALEFAAKWSKDHRRPVVFNMSFGIGPAADGATAVDSLVDRFLLKHPGLVFVTSCGNNGPGTSTAGTPSAAPFAFTTGALFPAGLSRELYGGALRRDLPFHFSSRGGIAMKPDALAPGAASSSVPPYAGGDVMWGTSMASPQAGGAMALLVSAAIATKTPYTWATLKEAVRGTAKPLAGYTPLDQGAGVIQVPAAWTAAQGLAPRVGSPFLAARVSAESPFPDGAEAQGAYWRTGGVFPEPPDGDEVTVTPAFADTASPDRDQRFYRTYRLESDAPWLRVDRDRTYLKSAAAQKFTVFYDASRLKEPGLYVGRVRAYAEGVGGPRVPEWESWHTVIVPYEFNAVNGFRRSWTGEGLEPGGIRRYFLRVPAGATSLTLDLSIPEGKQGRARLMVDDPRSTPVGGYRGYAEASDRAHDVLTVSGEALRPGTWEVTVLASYKNGFDSAYELTSEVEAFGVEPDTVRTLDLPQGEAPRATVTVTDLFDRRFRGSAEGAIEGYRRERTVTVDGSSRWKSTFRMGSDLRRAEFRFRLPADVYNRLTDCSVRILDKDGKTLAGDAFGTKELTLALDNPAPEAPEPAAYTLEVWGGFTEPGADSPWSFSLRESYLEKSPDAVTVTRGERAVFDLWPGAPAELTLSLAGPPRMAPAGTVRFGEVRFLDAHDQRVRLRLPVALTGS